MSKEKLSTVSQKDFLDAMSNAVSSVSVVTTGGIAGKGGLTISSMCSVSAEPPAILICINQRSPVLELIHINKNFCVNLLELNQIKEADVFAGRIAEFKHNRFECTSWRIGSTEAPVMTEALVAIECILEKADIFASHAVLIGTVVDIHSRTREPLVYTNRTYHRVVSMENYSETA